MIITSSTQLIIAFLIVGIGFIAIWELFKIGIFKVINYFGYKDIKELAKEIKSIYFE